MDYIDVNTGYEDFVNAKIYLCKTIGAVKAWLESVKLALAIGKYLGTMVDAKLSFKQQLRYARGKSSATSIAVAEKISKIPASSHTCKLFIAKVMSSTLLYAVAA